MSGAGVRIERPTVRWMAAFADASVHTAESTAADAEVAAETERPAAQFADPADRCG